MRDETKTQNFAYQTEIENILKQALSGKKYRLYLFGSRAEGRHTLASDIDLAVLADTPVERELSLARELLAESHIPVNVDLIDLSRTTASFRAQVLQEGDSLMGTLRQRLESCRQALDTLDEALQMPFSIIVRDGTIQRFEYSFESIWKLLKVYLAEYEGIICSSPKQCFREALNTNLLTAEEAADCLAMTDDRNMTSHTYIEAVAEAIYQKLPRYASLMRKLLTQIEEKCSSPRTI